MNESEIKSLADRIESAARKIEIVFGSEYGGNGARLVELMEWDFKRRPDNELLMRENNILREGLVAVMMYSADTNTKNIAGSAIKKANQSRVQTSDKEIGK